MRVSICTCSGSNGSDSSNDQQYSSSDGSIHIGSVDANNQLLVRARPSQWEEMKSAIKKLDNVPLQVQIETRILEVTLTNEFQFGVQYYLDGLTGATPNADGSITPGENYRHRNIGVGGGGTIPTSTDNLFYSFINSNTQVAISALETSGNTKVLSAPSMVVLNNQEAHIQVGDQVPINQTSLIGLGGTSSTDTTASSVSYIPTGVILDVQPRVNPGGLVYLNVHQQVSAAGIVNSQGNPTISQRDVATQVAVQSGQTVLLGGLITQNNMVANTGVPFLSDIPFLGRLFGTTTRNRTRTELIVLITPKVIRGSEDAKQITDEYQSKFESLQPLNAKGAPTTPMALAISTALQSSGTGGLPPSPTYSPVETAGITPTVAPTPSWPEQLQQHAEDALRQSDYATAQDLAMQSWRQGPRSGSLCQRNWAVIAQARLHNSRLGSADAARKQQNSCLASP
jgi:general secretion pathway protein D